MGMEKRLLTIWWMIAGAAAISVAASAFADDTNARAGMPMAIAQAGSTGGTIGKQGKSAAGENEPPTRRSRSNDGKVSDASGVSVNGRWRWSADCASGGRWHGEFVLTPTSQGQFAGAFGGTVFGDEGTITEDHIDGASISFTRHTWIWTQIWKGHLTSGRMAGSLSGNANCSWEASRK